MLHLGFVVNWAVNDPERLQKASARHDRLLLAPASGDLTELPAVAEALQQIAAARARHTTPE